MATGSYRYLLHQRSSQHDEASRASPVVEINPTVSGLSARPSIRFTVGAAATFVTVHEAWPVS